MFGAGENPSPGDETAKKKESKWKQLKTTSHPTQTPTLSQPPRNTTPDTHTHTNTHLRRRSSSMSVLTPTVYVFLKIWTRETV